MRIIIPDAKAGQLRMLVVQPTGEPERLESRIRVAENYTILVVFDALAMNPSALLNNQLHRAEVINDNATAHSVPGFH